MLIYTTGDIFSSPAQIITNPVNCVGVMGAGLALEFKNRYPAMFSDYQVRCKNKQVIPGRPYLFEDGNIQILNFPTKRHWKDKSELADIEQGLKYLAQNHGDLGIFYLALPPLGCGLGGLKWSAVKALFEKYFADHPDLEVIAYEPAIAKIQVTDNKQSNSPVEPKKKIAAQPDL